MKKGKIPNIMAGLATRRRLTFTLLRILLDAVLAVISLFLAYNLRFHSESFLTLELFDVSNIPTRYLYLLLLAPLGRLLSNLLAGEYRGRSVLTGDFFTQIRSVTQGSTALIVIAFLYRGTFSPDDTFTFSRIVLGLDWLLYLFLQVATYSLLRIIRDECHRRGYLVQGIAIQGTSTSAEHVADAIEKTPELRHGLRGFIADGDDDLSRMRAMNLPFLGSVTDIRNIVNDGEIDTLIVTDPANLGPDPPAILKICHDLDVVVVVVPNLTGIAFQSGTIHDLAGIPIFQVNEIAITGFQEIVKRAEDIVLSMIVLILVGPILLLAIAGVKLDTPGPAFYVQKRVGKNGRHFNLFKLRSMKQNADAMRSQLEDLNESEGVLFKMKDDPRITRFGAFIRKTCIDELPQIFNVLRGEMSLVGPRPLPATDLTGDAAWKHARVSVRPGMTGLWQVNRITHTPEEMFKWDLHYIENWSIWYDFRIMWKTIFVVLTQRGSY